MESGKEINGEGEENRKNKKTWERGSVRDGGGEGVPVLYQLVSRAAWVAIGFGFFARGSQWKRDQSFQNGQNA